jgi:5-methylthioadenosine/S-adenosylhomocysteine deaminase
MLLVRGGTVVTMDERRTVIADGAVLVDGERIRDIGPATRLARTPGITQTIAADAHLILPGLVNAHNHAFQTLYRGLGHGRPLAEWSSQCIFPMSRWLTAAEAGSGTRLACLEMIETGTTTFVDSFYIHLDPGAFDAVAAAVADSGLRAVLGRASLDGPVVAEEFREKPSVARGRAGAAIERWHGAAGGRIRVRPEALSERTATVEMIGALSELGRAAGTGFNMHCAESRPGRDGFRAAFGKTPLAHLHEVGATGADVLLAHAVWMDEADIALLATTGTRVAHNPISNQYLTAGVAPIPAMLRAGVVVGLGTDGAASNNNLDMFGVMKACGLLHKVVAGDAAAVPAERIVAMATIDGAHALGLQREIGSLEPGKQADLITVSCDRPEMVPLHSVYESLVYSAVAAAVDTVVVAGRVLAEGGRARGVDRGRLFADARQAATRMASRAGLA